MLPWRNRLGRDRQLADQRIDFASLEFARFIRWSSGLRNSASEARETTVKSAHWTESASC